MNDQSSCFDWVVVLVCFFFLFLLFIFISTFHSHSISLWTGIESSEYGVDWMNKPLVFKIQRKWILCTTNGCLILWHTKLNIQKQRVKYCYKIDIPMAARTIPSQITSPKQCKWTKSFWVRCRKDGKQNRSHFTLCSCAYFHITAYRQTVIKSNRTEKQVNLLKMENEIVHEVNMNNERNTIGSMHMSCVPPFVHQKYQWKLEEKWLQQTRNQIVLIW